MRCLWITALSVFFATAFLACSDGPIEARSGEDDTALAYYGPINPDGMNDLVNTAMADCMNDSLCLEALRKMDGADIPVPDEGVSPDSGTANENGDASSGGSQGPVIASSANGSPQSSPSTSSGSADMSSAGGNSSAVVASSSSKGSSILNGTCKAVPETVERGQSVTWSYITINGSPAQTYDWTFESGSVTTSKDAKPSLSYNAKGTYGASLVVDKGLATEKSIGCRKVTVTGIKVSGCVCSASSSAVVVSSSKPKNVTWTVSGCTGADPFTYTWAGGASGTGTSATMTLKSVGTYTPTVTVTNSDGMTMNPTCATVTATEMPGATCNVGEHNYDANKASMSVVPGQTFYFKPNNVTGVTGTMSMTLAGGGTSKTISVANGTNNSATAVKAPVTLGTHAYTLSVDGEEVCSADVTVAYANITTTCSFKSTIPGGTATFNVGSMSGWTDATGGSVTMVLSGNSTSQNLTIGRYSNGDFSVPAPTAVGEYEYTLTYQGNQACKATMKVEPITASGCAIEKDVWSSGKDYFSPGSKFSSNWTGSSANMTLTLDGEEIVSDKPVSNGYNTPQWQQVTLPTEPGTYVYTLTHMGNTVCEVEYEVD